MVAADEEGEVRSFASSAVILVEVTYSSELVGHGHSVEVVGVPHCLGPLAAYKEWIGITADLEVTANDE